MTAANLVDLVKVNVLSAGSGSFVLGSAVYGFRGTEALADGSLYSYSIQKNGDYEVGFGLWVAASATLTRSPTASSNGNAPVAFSGAFELSFVARAADLVGRGSSSPVTVSYEMNDASFDMAGDFGSLITVTCTQALTANRTLGLSCWASLAQANNLPLRQTNDLISVRRVDAGPFWLAIALVNWSTTDNAWSYVPIWGFHPGMACGLTSGSAHVSTADTTGMVIGTSIEGPYVPAGAVVQSIDNKTSFTMAYADHRPALAAATGSQTLSFGGSLANFKWTGNGWNTNPGTLEQLIAGQTNYTQTGRMNGAPYTAFWSQWNVGSLEPGDSTTNSIVAYPAMFPNATILNWNWPNYAPSGVWGYGFVSYGDYAGGPTPPLGFSSTGPKPIQHKDTAFFEAPYAYHVRWQSDGADWDLLTEYWLYATDAPSRGNTTLVEVAWTPRAAHYGTIMYPQYEANFLGVWTDKFGVAWNVNGKRGKEIVFSPANGSEITGGTIDYRGGAAYLISQGQVDGTEWNHGAAFGMEPIVGSGSLQIDRWEPVLGGGKVTLTPGTPPAPSLLSGNNLSLTLGYTVPSNAVGCVYTTDGGATFSGWGATTHTTRRLRPGTTYNVGVAGYNDGLRGGASPTVSMATTFAEVDFSSSSLWESTLINDATSLQHVTVTPATYTLPGGSTPKGALVQDVSGASPVTCRLKWSAVLPSLLPGTYGLSVYYNNIGDNLNFALSIFFSPSRYLGFNVEDNALAYFGVPGLTDGFYGGSFSTSEDVFKGVTFDGCQGDWWRVTGLWDIIDPVAAGGEANITLLYRDPVSGKQYETPYTPNGSGELGFSRFALQAVDFSTANSAYYGANLAAPIVWTPDHSTATSVTAWDGVGLATKYLEQTGSAVTTGVNSNGNTVTVDTAAHEYIACFDVEPLGRDFLTLVFDNTGFTQNLSVTFQLSTRQATAVSTGGGGMTCAQCGVVLLAPGRYRVWARVHKPAAVTTLFFALYGSGTSSTVHTGDATKGFVLQPNSRICQVL